MAGWKKVQDGVTPGWYVDVTTAAGGTGDVSTPIIDWIPSDKTFTVIYNTKAVATNTNKRMNQSMNGRVNKQIATSTAQSNK